MCKKFLVVFSIALGALASVQSLPKTDFESWDGTRICTLGAGYDIAGLCSSNFSGSTGTCGDMNVELEDEDGFDTFSKRIVDCYIGQTTVGCISANENDNDYLAWYYDASEDKCHDPY